MATEKRDDEIGVTAVGLESLERNFVDVMKELSAEDSLERFRFEYEKLHRALKKSHESEKRLTKKCQELHEEIMANTTKLHTALYLSQDDENTILSLRKEIEKAWKTVDVNQEKELKAKDTIKQLRKDVVRLTSLVEQGAGLSSEHESNIQDLIDKKRELARTRDATRLKVHQQDHEIDELNGKLKKLQTDLEVTDIDLVAKKTQYQQQYKNFETHQKERDISERKVREFHLAIEKRAKEAEVAKETLRVRASEQETLDLEVVEEKDRLASLVKRVAEAQQQLADETQSLSKVDHQNIQLRGEIPRMQHVLDKKEEELVRVNRNVDKILRVIDGQDAELVRLNAEQEEEAAKIPLIKDKIDKYLIEIASERNLIESHDKAAADIMARKNLTINKWANEESERVKLEGMRILEEGNNRSLTHTLATHLETNQLMRDKIGILNQQQKKYFEDAREATGKYHYVVEEEKLTTERSATLKLELDDVDMKLKNRKRCIHR